jgi:hypothetical protein
MGIPIAVVVDNVKVATTVKKKHVPKLFVVSGGVLLTCGILMLLENSRS